MKKIYRVALSEEEEAELQGLMSKGKTSVHKLTRARILLLVHAGQKDRAVARALQTNVSTVVILFRFCGSSALRVEVRGE